LVYQFLTLIWPVWVPGTVVIEYAQSVSWPDGTNGILNQG